MVLIDNSEQYELDSRQVSVWSIIVCLSLLYVYNMDNQLWKPKGSF
jgi:hypothetical protein